MAQLWVPFHPGAASLSLPADTQARTAHNTQDSLKKSSDAFLPSKLRQSLACSGLCVKGFKLSAAGDTEPVRMQQERRRRPWAAAPFVVLCSAELVPVSSASSPAIVCSRLT